MPTFQTIHTNYGLSRITAALSSGVPINLTQLAVGDGGGSSTTPAPTQTGLVHEVWRGTVNRIVTDPALPGRIFVEAVIPFDAGGWTIREFGIFDDAGQLFVVGNFPATYKSVPSDGASTDVILRVEIVMSNTAVITLVVDPSVTIATQSWVLTNVTRSTLAPGGTTGQVWTKLSNVSGDADWRSPGSSTIIVDAVEEPVTALAAGQATINLTTCTTLGLVVFIEGVRIPKATGVDGWQQGTSNTQVVLGRSYPAGSRFTAVQNFPAGQIGNPLQAGNNLSDLASAATARTNLGVYSKAESDAAGAAGNVGFTARATAPTGWLVANGAAVSRSVYATLFSAIGTAYGVGDGSTTFNLPDGRGVFFRGLDGGRGLDSGRTIGSFQSDAIQNITGALSMINGGGVAGSGAFLANGTATSHITAGLAGSDNSFTFDASRVVRTSTETRPSNIALLPIIKF